MWLPQYFRQFSKLNTNWNKIFKSIFKSERLLSAAAWSNKSLPKLHGFKKEESVKKKYIREKFKIQ